MEKNAKSIVEMARGAILERINYEMARVMDNIPGANQSCGYLSVYRG